MLNARRPSQKQKISSVQESNEEEDESLEALDDAADAAIGRVASKDLNDDEKIEKMLMRAVKRSAEATFGKRPIVDVTVLRV